MNRKKWDTEQLISAVKTSTSVRQVIAKLGLVEAGGNYQQVKDCISSLKLNVSHFTGQAWNRGKKGLGKPRIDLRDILKNGSSFQSYKLKKRLFAAGLKEPKCEKCGWAQKTFDGRLPLELDHINGSRRDNRLNNLQILCPNCHSLQPTHRGKNKKRG